MVVIISDESNEKLGVALKEESRLTGAQFVHFAAQNCGLSDACAGFPNICRSPSIILSFKDIAENRNFS